MYVYQVTNVTTNNFYISYEDMVMHQNQMNLDPMNVFGDSSVHNGDTMMGTLSKQILQRVGDKNEAKDILANIAKHHEDNIHFLGVKMSIKPPKEVVSSKVINKEKEI